MIINSGAIMSPFVEFGCYYVMTHEWMELIKLLKLIVFW